MLKFLTSSELCETLHISESTLHKWRGSGLPHVRLGRKIFYQSEKVQAWLQIFEIGGLANDINKAQQNLALSGQDQRQNLEKINLRTRQEEGCPEIESPCRISPIAEKWARSLDSS